MPRLASMLLLLLLHQVLTSIPIPATAGASSVPRTLPHNKAVHKTGSPFDSTTQYGMETASATGHGERAPSSLPTRNCRRLAGVSRIPSKVPRSRSPLMLSAPMIKQMNSPTVMEALTISEIISTRGRRFISALLASRNQEPP